MAKQLDWEKQNSYNLTIAVTDGVNEARTSLLVKVIDVNDHRPEFLELTYKAEVSENLVGKDESILRLEARDKDEDGRRLFYSLHNAQSTASLQLFHVDTFTGAISLTEALDREAIEEHVLTVSNNDQSLS